MGGDMIKTGGNSTDGSRCGGMTEDELHTYRQTREYERRKRQKRKQAVVVVAAAAIVLLAVVLNWQKFAPVSVSDSVRSFFGLFVPGKFPLTLPSGDFKSAVSIGSNIGVLSDTDLFLYSKSGTLLAQRPHGMSDPHLVSGGGRAVLFDRGGKQFKVETRFSESFSGSTDYPIVTACVAKNGEFAVVSESGSYLSELNIYDTRYHSVFKWYSSQGRILAAALSPDGSHVAAVTVGAKNGAITSSINIFDTGKQTPVAVKNYDGVLLLSIQYASAGHIIAVGDTETVFLSSDGKKAADYPYGDKTLRCYVNSAGSAVLALGTYGVGNKSTLVSFTADGKTAGQADISGDASAVYDADGHILVLRSADIWLGSSRCKPAGTLPVSGDKLEALPAGDSAYVFGLQAIYRFALTKK